MLDSERLPRARRAQQLAFSVLMALLGIATGLLLFGLPLLVLGWFDDDDGGIHKFHSLGWAALMGLLFAVPAFLQMRHPERKPAAFQQLAAALVGVVFGYAVAGDFSFLSLIVVLAILAGLVAVHPARQVLFARPRVSPLLVGTAVIAAVPLFLYALDQGELQRTLPVTEPHTDGEHWSDMAKIATAIPLVGIVAGLRAPGFRIPASCAGAALMLLGAASVVYPDQASSFGRVWGVIAIVGAAGFIAAAERDARRDAMPARF